MGQKMFHRLKLLSTHLPVSLSDILVWGGGTRFGVCCVMVTGVVLLSPLGTSSNLSCLKLFCNSFSNASQARRELSRLKEEARNKHAIAVIWAYWLGSKVLDTHIPFLRPGICNDQFVPLAYQGMNDYN